jgi:hypothetical protein
LAVPPELGDGVVPPELGDGVVVPPELEDGVLVPPDPEDGVVVPPALEDGEECTSAVGAWYPARCFGRPFGGAGGAGSRVECSLAIIDSWLDRPGGGAPGEALAAVLAVASGTAIAAAVTAAASMR